MYINTFINSNKKIHSLFKLYWCLCIFLKRHIQYTEDFTDLEEKECCHCNSSNKTKVV